MNASVCEEETITAKEKALQLCLQSQPESFSMVIPSRLVAMLLQKLILEIEGSLFTVLKKHGPPFC